MIHGVGTDIAAVARLAALYEKHGERALEKLLAPAEREGFERAADRGRFLAKRFAAKEAFGKALGIGVAAPATLPNVTIDHDTLGKPVFAYAPSSTPGCASVASLPTSRSATRRTAPPPSWSLNVFQARPRLRPEAGAFS